MSQSNICKKPGQFAKMCRSQTPPLSMNRGQFQQRQQQQTRNVKNINEEDNQIIAPSLEEEEDDIETIDPEPAMYITELIEDWNKINLIERDFRDIRNHDLNNTTPQGEIIIQTTLKNNSKLNWLADIPIIGQFQMELRSGSMTAKNCYILVVKHKSQNLMGRDILGLTLTQQQATKGKKILNISKNVFEQNRTKYIFKKHPPLCTRLRRSENHIAKIILKKEKTPTRHKGRRVPFASCRKIRKRITETNQR